MSRSAYIILLVFFLLPVQCGPEAPVPVDTGRTEAPGSSGDPEEPDAALSPFLPEKEALGAWKATGEPRQFVGDDLFIYINGGAEIYHEYGFRRVVIQEFRNDGGNTINLEIFEMDRERNAFGLYSIKRSVEGEAVSLGNHGMLEGYYLNFWKGNQVVTLTGQDGDPETVNGLKTIGAAVDARIPAGGKVPELVGFLEGEGLITASVRFIVGNLGLYNSHAFFTNNVFDFDEAVMGRYENRLEVLVFQYRDGSECGKRYDKVRKAFETGDGYSAFTSFDGGFSVRDRKGRQVLVRPGKRFIVVVVGKGARAVVDQAMAKVLKNINGTPHDG